MKTCKSHWFASLKGYETVYIGVVIFDILRFLSLGLKKKVCVCLHANKSSVVWSEFKKKISYFFSLLHYVVSNIYKCQFDNDTADCHKMRTTFYILYQV